MNWNKAQSQAIDTKGKNILVSAAAGSGKTAVLVERIKKLILVDRVPVDRFLVVTFTEAAASEMKEKIIAALKDAAENQAEEDAGYIRRQIELVDTANISTFHGFAREIIRRYFYAIGLEPDMSVADETNATILKRQALDNIFARGYEENNQEFLDFVLAYGTDRHDNAAKELVLDMYEKMMSIPDPYIWLDEMTEDFSVTFDEFLEGKYVSRAKRDTIDAIHEMIRAERTIAEILSTNNVVLLAEKISERCDLLESYDYEGMSFEELGDFVSSYSVVSIGSKPEKEYLDPIKDKVKAVRENGRRNFLEVKEAYFAMTAEEYWKDIHASSHAAGGLRKLVRELGDEYTRLKRAKSYIDFNDIEHYALEILEKEPKACEEYRSKFEYILIDEYQDTNEVQETLIKHIARDDNLFMVGDVKQSIYGFRLADPDIFLDKYYSFDEDPDSVRIDLNVNYRSQAGRNRFSKRHIHVEDDRLR